MTANRVAGVLAAGLILTFGQSGPAASAPQPEPPVPPCGNRFPPAVFGSLQFGSGDKGRRAANGKMHSGAWRVDNGEYNEVVVKWLDLKEYKGPLPFSLNRKDSPKAARRKLAAHFPNVSIAREEFATVDRRVLYTSNCKNRFGIQQRLEVEFSMSGVMSQVSVVSESGMYERFY